MIPPPRIALLKCAAVSLPGLPCAGFVCPGFQRKIPYETQDLLQRQISWDENSPNENKPQQGCLFSFQNR
jgi:hypothetical protein